MSDAIQIRPVTAADFDAWLPLWDAYNAFYGRSGETALPREITQVTWGRFFDGYEPMHAMVAERNGQLLGLVHFLYHRHTTMVAPTCYLQDLYTLEAERGKGVGDDGLTPENELLEKPAAGMGRHGCSRLVRDSIPLERRRREDQPDRIGWHV